MPANQKKRFARGRAILNRLPSAPELMTLPELEFYTGASLRAIRGWVQEWIAEGFIGQTKIGYQVAGPGSPWQVNRKPLITWVIARKYVRFPPEYGFPSPEAAEDMLGALKGKVKNT